MFYCIARQNLSQRPAGVLFNRTQSCISRQFSFIVEHLHAQFVPDNMGSSTLTRDEIISNHVPEFVKSLLPNVVGILDGTHFQIQKSWNFNIQKRMWSNYKCKNTLKEMGIMLPDGYWWDFEGPYLSDGYHNDEIIFNSMTDPDPPTIDHLPQDSKTNKSLTTEVNWTNNKLMNTFQPGFLIKN